MANEWMTQDIGNANAPLADPGMLTWINMLGKMGAGMLKGTNQEWIGAPGAAAADTASNVQAGGVNQQHLKNLQTLAKVLKDPLMQSGTTKLGADGSITHTINSTPNADLQQPQAPGKTGMVPSQIPTVNNQPQTAAPSANGQYAEALSNYPFLRALRLWS